MTERLYYTDAYSTTFEARVVARASLAGSPAVILDRTLFYPTSGGQPHDTGTLNGVPVVDVMVREADGAVLHVLAGDLSAERVTGEIDWARRFDHMQHHTGQHILTAAFLEAAGADTVSFHLGSQAVTLDLDRADLADAEIAAAEALANRIVTQDLPVRVLFPTEAEAAALPLRKRPEVNGKLRVVQIGEIDATACGGTHVARTGEIGLIKVVRAERYKGLTRVAFLCGGRALRDYGEKHAILMALSAELTTGYAEIGDALAKLRAENKQLRADLRAARQALLVHEAAELLAATPVQDGVRVIVGVWEARDPAEIRPLASRLVETPGTVALLGIAGASAQVVAARAADLDGPDMAAVLRGVLARLSETARGGGRPDFVQGGGVMADAGALRAALDAAAEEVRRMLAASEA
ncbi:MAG: DHHA1 domain-containing protein [Anaerolineae bacterium]